MADRALASEFEPVVCLEAPELAEVPRSLLRADGRSVYQRHGGTRYAAPAARTHTGLREDQAAAVVGGDRRSARVGDQRPGRIREDPGADGGALGYARLAEPVRFRHQWEQQASLLLRDGDTTVLADYDQHGRIIGGEPEQMMDAAAAAYVALSAAALRRT
jgi:hypothetical protein